MIEAITAREVDHRGGQDWSGATLSQLACHIEARHHALLRHELSRLSALFDEVVHAHAEAVLHRIRELMSSCALSKQACPGFRALCDGLQALEAELHEHIHLENDILFPKAVAAAHSSGLT